jgi:hypothetical protein
MTWLNTEGLPEYATKAYQPLGRSLSESHGLLVQR